MEPTMAFGVLGGVLDGGGLEESGLRQSPQVYYWMMMMAMTKNRQIGAVPKR